MKARRRDPVTRPQPPAGDVPGFAARRIAADVLDGVLRRRRALDDEFEAAAARAAFSELAGRDRAFVRALTATALRRLGTLRHLIGFCLEEGLPPQAPRVETALLVGAAQILFLDVPDHAAVDLSVRFAQADRQAARYAGLVNAVLRRLAREGGAARRRLVGRARHRRAKAPGRGRPHRPLRSRGVPRANDDRGR